MFIKELSDEAYLELVAKHGIVECYQDSSKPIVGFVSIEGEVPLYFITVYEPKYDKNFIVLRTDEHRVRLNAAYYSKAGAGQIYTWSRLLSPPELHELTQIQDAFVEFDSSYRYIEYRIKRQECS